MKDAQKLEVLNKHFSTRTDVSTEEKMTIDGVLNQMNKMQLLKALRSPVRVISVIAHKKLRTEYGYTEDKLTLLKS